MSISGVVLAGGRSSRFGRDKALLDAGNGTLLQRTVNTLRVVTQDVLVLGPPERASQLATTASVEVLQDDIANLGPLGGICTALRARPGSAILVVAVDLPFLSAPLLRHLASLADSADVVLPIVGGRGQQTHAVYGPACLVHIEPQLAGGDFKIDRFFPQVHVRRVEEEELRLFDPALDSFRNVNTPDAWLEALAELRSHPT